MATVYLFGFVFCSDLKYSTSREMLASAASREFGRSEAITSSSPHTGISRAP